MSATAVGADLMDIISRIAYRSLKANRARTLVSLGGVILSSLLVTAIFTSVSTFTNVLIESTVATSGSWQVSFSNLSQEDAADARADERVTSSAEIERYGFCIAESGDEDDGYFTYLLLSSLPKQSRESTTLPEISLVEGRMPQNSHEVLIPETIRGYTYDEGFSNDGFQQSNSFMVGTDIGMALGRRAMTGTDDFVQLNEYNSVSFDDRGNITETLVDVAPMRTFTVVGIYSMEGVFNEVFDSPAGCSLFTYDDDGIDPTHTSLYVEGKDLGSYEEVEGLAHRFDGTDGDIGATIHQSLLNYEGLTDDASASMGFWAIGAFLAGIVIIASIALIYNSFAISVAERTRQFGLLASLGASKSQLRREILSETIPLAAIGIPAGIVLGIASTKVAFSLTQDGLLALLYGNGAIETLDMGISIVASPIVVMGIAALEVATLVASAAIPALRASKVSPVEALRETESSASAGRGESRGPLKAIARLRRSLSQKMDSLFIRVGGVPHFMARRNLRRTNSKGRVAVASLALSVALLVVSGTLAQYIEQASNIAVPEGVDVTVTLDRYPQDGEGVADLLKDSSSIFAELSKNAYVQPVGYSSLISSFGSFSKGVYNANAYDAILAESKEFVIDDTISSDGSYFGLTNIEFVDEDSWRSYISTLGLDEKRYCDPSNPVAVGYNGGSVGLNGKYFALKHFTSTGTASLYASIKTVNDAAPSSIVLDEKDNPVVTYYQYDDSAKKTQLQLDEAVEKRIDVEIGATADTAPACAVNVSGYYSPVLILPMSALEYISNQAAPAVEESMRRDREAGVSELSRWTENSPFSFFPSQGNERLYHRSFSTDYAFASPNSRLAASDLSRELDKRLNNRSVYPFGSVSDTLEETRAQRAIILAVKIFSGCFAGITTLIAVANVFNTISTSFVARRREFAILRSMGMDKAMFRSMILRECASYAIRGLVFGLVLAFAVLAIVLYIMGGVFIDVVFVLSPEWMGISAAVVLAVLAASTVYSLQKEDGDNVADTLKEDL